MVEPFLRARSPDQKAQRRGDILAAACRLLDSHGAEGTTLAAIAAEAGVVKSAIYRYFASREAILMEILIADLNAAITDFEMQVARHGRSQPHGPDALAGLITDSFADRPRMCLLISILASVLENNLSEDAVAGYKTALYAESGRATAVLHAALPGLGPSAGDRAVLHMHVLVAGLWPFANPSPTVSTVMTRPEFAGLSKEFRPTLRDGIATHLRGLLAESAAR
ncbi:MAG: TetR family transcriptional regulator [Pseudomonadota bacterium]